MKKLLAILSSLGITAVASSSVVACSQQQMRTWAIPNSFKMDKNIIILSTDYDAKSSIVTIGCSSEIELKEEHVASDFSLAEFDSQVKVDGFQITDSEIKNGDVFRSGTDVNIKLSSANKSLLKVGTKYQMYIKGINPSDDTSNNWFVYGE